MTKRQYIIDKVIERLKLISTASGYSCTPNVFEWLETPHAVENLPAIVARDMDDQIENDTYGSSAHRMEVEIEAIMSNGKLSHNKLRELIKDILQVLKYDEDDIDFVEYREIVKIEMAGKSQDYIFAGARISMIVTYCTPSFEI